MTSAIRTWLHDRLDLSYRSWLRVMTDELAGCSSVLDVGCGTSSPLAAVPGRFRSVGVDAYRPALEESASAGIHDDYVERDVRDLGFATRSFDAVVMLDLIEHLTPEEGARLLLEADRIARRVVILTTPNGFLRQHPYGGNELQMHRSGWTVPDLQAAGFSVYGMNGLKPLRGELSYPRRPRVVTRPLSLLSQPLVYRRPDRAFELLGVKRLDAQGLAPLPEGQVPDSAGSS